VFPAKVDSKYKVAEGTPEIKPASTALNPQIPDI